MAYEWDTPIQGAGGDLDQMDTADLTGMLQNVPSGPFSVDEILQELSGGDGAAPSAASGPEAAAPAEEAKVLQGQEAQSEEDPSPASEEAPVKKKKRCPRKGKTAQDQEAPGAAPVPGPGAFAEGTSDEGAFDTGPLDRSLFDTWTIIEETKAPVSQENAPRAQSREPEGKVIQLHMPQAQSAGETEEPEAAPPRTEGKREQKGTPPKPPKTKAIKEAAGDDDDDDDVLNFRKLWRKLSSQAEDYAKTMYEEEAQEEEARRPHEAFLKGTGAEGEDAEGGAQEERFFRDGGETQGQYAEDEFEEDDEEEDAEEAPRGPKWPWLSRLLGSEGVEEDLGPERFPSEMADAYKKRIGRLRLRAFLVCFIGMILAYTAIAQQYGWPFPGGRFSDYLSFSVVLACAAAVLGLDVMQQAFRGLFHMKADATILATVSLLASILDGFTLLFFQNRTETLPFCAVSVFSLFFAMWGTDLGRRNRRMIYRTASVENPYLVTKDKDKWSGGGCFTKHPGPIRGFVNQVEAPDGAERVYRRMAPLLLLACLLFSLVAAFGKAEAGPFLWCFSALTAAAASFSASIAYAAPRTKLTRRLVKVGAVLAGWRGISAMAGKTVGMILTDLDLFPPGTVFISGRNTFGQFSADTVVAYTASIIKETGCGLDHVFHMELRAQGTLFRPVDDLSCYDEGGYSATIRGQHVLVGTAAFLQGMKVHLAPGLSVRNAVFCAIDGELAGIFALKYIKNQSVNGALTALFRSKITPVVATRDFNLTPDMLSGRFKLKFKEVEFPKAEERLMLSDGNAPYDLPITAMLFREGLTPFIDAVVGGRRLHRVALIGTLFSVLGSIAGVLLAFYLTYVQAYTSMSAVNLLVFMFMWLVPGFLTSRGINRY